MLLQYQNIKRTEEGCYASCDKEDHLTPHQIKIGSTHAHLNDRSLRTHPGRWSSAFVDISGRRKRSVLLKDLSFEAAELLHQNSNPKGKGIYPCRGCGKVYRWYQNLVVHQRIECGKEPQFQCPYCPSRTTQKSSLITHIKRRHPDNQYQVTSSDMELF
ncbi:putative zinc finger protein 355P [Schistocerca gregaria]|uniref:putative zinc finger protein 355P n=1 Tax=Schistocerca gregaria TaxID=7010 RepID=UPI00211E3F90|nr:putative zinc finger protein 355P [Schistocerca gregaria]